MKLAPPCENSVGACRRYASTLTSANLSTTARLLAALVLHTLLPLCRPHRPPLYAHHVRSSNLSRRVEVPGVHEPPRRCGEPAHLHLICV